MNHADYPLATDQAETAAAIPTREEIPDQDRWDLSRLYAKPEDWEKDFAKLESLLPEADQFRGAAARSAESLLEVLEFEKHLHLLLERLYHYASLQLSENASSNLFLERSGRIQNLYSRVMESLSFLNPEIQALPDDVFDAYLADGKLGEWHLSLSKLRRFKPHTLSPREEKLMAMSLPAFGGIRSIFSQLTNVDMKFGEVKDETGRPRTLSQSSLSSFLVNPERRVRREAFHNFYHEIRDHQYTLAGNLQTSVKADIFSARARNHPSALEAALFPDQIPVEVYDNLIATVRKRLPEVFRYFEVRRTALDLDELHHYDTYVPLVSELSRKTSFEEATEMMLESLAPLGAEYVDNLRRGFADRWVDRYESKGKRSGAFSSSSYGNPPYILMNYKEDVFSDIYTLTHEAGHSMHSWFSQRHQRFQDYDYPIFLAEVASTFNEMLLTHYLLEKSDDRRMRAYVINRQIDDLRGTLVRQTMFAEFEKKIHEIEEAGGGLTLERMRSVYRELLDAYFGENFVVDEDLEFECLRIPHFYSAFYVYKYATGVSAAAALAERVLAGHGSALEDYLGFLKSGGSRYPLETLEAAGVDMRSPAPVEAALDLFARRVTELERLLKD